MLFIYWGWDTSVSVNEETSNKHVTPGRAAVFATVILLVIYEVVVLAARSYAGLGTKGIGLGNPNHQGDVIGPRRLDFRLVGFRECPGPPPPVDGAHLPRRLYANHNPPYREDDAFHGRVQGDPGQVRPYPPQFLTPTWSTVAMGGVSIILYVIMNYISANNVISDSVTALGVLIAYYYGLTGLACFWFYRRSLRKSTRNLFVQGSCRYWDGRSCGPSAAIAWCRTGSPRAAIRPGTSPASAGTSAAPSCSPPAHWCSA